MINIIPTIVAAAVIVALKIRPLYCCPSKKGEEQHGERQQGIRAIGLSLFIAILSLVIGTRQRYIGAPMVALISGVFLSNALPEKVITAQMRSIAGSFGKLSLNFGVVILGATLSLLNFFRVAHALPLLLVNICVSFVVSWQIGIRVLNQTYESSMLVGAGTSICGGSAIAALAPVIKANEQDTVFAMTSIFLFDLIACFSYPYLALGLQLTDSQFAILAGASINDTASVIVAQESYAQLSGLENYAAPASIKMMRTTLIILIVLIFNAITLLKSAKNDKLAHTVHLSVRHIFKSMPSFVYAFLGAMIVNSVITVWAGDTIIYNNYVLPMLKSVYKTYITVALASISLRISLRDIVVRGARPIVLGGLTWLAVFLTSLSYCKL